MLTYLQDNLPQGGELPHIAKLLGSGEMLHPNPDPDPAAKPNVFRVFYWSYYNGRDLSYLIDAYRDLEPEKYLPKEFIARCAYQVLWYFSTST